MGAIPPVRPFYTLEEAALALRMTKKTLAGRLAAMQCDRRMFRSSPASARRTSSPELTSTGFTTR
jgi:hypothetical protein